MPSTTTDATKVAVLGLPAIGKTALVVKLLSGRFIWNYDPTLENVYKYSVADKVNDGEEECILNMEIMDTAGYTSMNVESAQLESYVKWADRLLVMYSIADLQSFEAARTLIGSVSEAGRFTDAIALVANKTDLQHLRQVEADVGRKLADEHGCQFYEISVRMDFDSIYQPFIDLCHNGKRKSGKVDRQLQRRSSASQRLKKLIQKKLSI